MINVALPSGFQRRPLPFYLAMEEWMAWTLPAGEYFFTWSVDPTVICGRHQDIPLEVDLAYCQEHGIDVVRRKSGGGCVYADQDNLMLSYVCPCTDVRTAFDGYTRRVAEALQGLGVEAEASGRNDVLIEGRKVSGGAFFRMTGRSIAHSTLLIRTNPEHMARAITPDRAKLLSHGVTSTKSRITTLSEHIPGITIEDVARHLVKSLTDSTITLTTEQVEQIEMHQRAYSRPDWLRLNPSAASPRRGQRVEGVGTICPVVTLHKGVIRGIDLKGDFLSVEDPKPWLMRCVGRKPESAELLTALDGIEQAIPGLSPHMLTEIIQNQLFA